jgi:ankyrin repeat protein
MAEEAMKMLEVRRRDEIASKAPELVQPDSTALHEACSRGDLDGVHALVKSDANINALDAKGTTAFVVAVERDNLKIVDLLLGMKARLDFVTTSEKSPLGLAIDKRNVKIARLLLDNNADPNANNTRSLLLRTHPL